MKEFHELSEALENVTIMPKELIGMELPIQNGAISFDASKPFTGVIYRGIPDRLAGQKLHNFRNLVKPMFFKFNPFRFKDGKLMRGSVSPAGVDLYECPGCKAKVQLDLPKVAASKRKGNLFCQSCFKTYNEKRELVRVKRVYPMVNKVLTTYMKAHFNNGHVVDNSADLLLPVFGVYEDGKAPGVWEPQTEMEYEAHHRAQKSGLVIRPLKDILRLQQNPKPKALIGLAKAMQIGWVNTDLLQSGREECGYTRRFPERKFVKQSKKQEAIIL